MNHKDYEAGTSFIDTLLNMLLFFVVAIGLLLIITAASKKNDNNAVVNGEYLITMTWDKESQSDVDLYLMEPSGNIVYFGNRDNGLSNLNRDDLGYINDRITLPSGEVIEYNENKEVITVRGKINGEYVVNSHMYYFRDKQPVNVTIVIEQINPFKTVYIKKFELKQNGDEETICRFTVNGNNTELSFEPLSLVKLKGR